MVPFLPTGHEGLLAGPPYLSTNAPNVEAAEGLCPEPPPV